MKIPNKRELQQTVINKLPNCDFKHFMKLYKRCTANSYSFLFNDHNFTPDNHLRFRSNLLEKI